MATRTRFAVLPVLALAVLVFVPRSRAQEAAGGDAPPSVAAIHTAPVEIDGHVLFTLRGVVGFPAEERATQVASAIRDAARDPAVQPADVKVREVDGVLEIWAGDTFVTRALDADARLEGVTRRELALVHVALVRRAIEAYRQARQPDRLWRAAAQAGFATALLTLFLAAVAFTYRRFDGFVARRLQRQIKDLEARSFEIVRAGRIRMLIGTAFRGLRVALVLGAVYLYLQHTLALFPWTRSIGLRLGAFIVDPLVTMWDAFLADIPDLIFLVVLGVVVFYGLRVLRLFFDGVQRGSIRIEGFDADWAEPTFKIVRVAIVAFSIVVAYPYIPGSGSEAFKGVSLFLGVIFSLGSSSVVSNIIAGYAMTYRRVFKVGDRVKVGGVVGDVVSVRLQVTHLRTPKNEEVVVPNSSILNAEVTNYSTIARTDGLILHTTVGIGYEVPWRQVEAMLLLAAERTSGLDPKGRPFVLQQGLGDFAVNYELNVYTREAASMAGLYSELHRSIQDVFNEFGVQIMTPNYVADTPEAKVVPKPQWYAAPARPPEGGDGPPPSGA